MNRDDYVGSLIATLRHLSTHGRGLPHFDGDLFLYNLNHMITVFKNLYQYRELIAALAWKNIVLRYKQAYLGILWAILKPIMLMLIFTLVRSFVGIETGDIPYPILTFAALLPWVFFQESASEGVNSVTANAALIKKIYFPREVFPITAMVTKIVELGISFFILAGMMIYYKMAPTIYALWRCYQCLLPGYVAGSADSFIFVNVRLPGHVSTESGTQKTD
jgi:ABC-type polysaccharide/polyol phosphate export permease